MAHDTKMSKSQNPSSYSLGGLTSLTKESQQRLEAYQHLFYQLQVNYLLPPTAYDLCPPSPGHNKVSPT